MGECWTQCLWEGKGGGLYGSVVGGKKRKIINKAKWHHARILEVVPGRNGVVTVQRLSSCSSIVGAGVGRVGRRCTMLDGRRKK